MVGLAQDLGRGSDTRAFFGAWRGGGLGERSESADARKGEPSHEKVISIVGIVPGDGHCRSAANNAAHRNATNRSAPIGGKWRQPGSGSEPGTKCNGHAGRNHYSANQ